MTEIAMVSQPLHLLVAVYILFVIVSIQFPEIFAGVLGSAAGKMVFIFIILCVTSIDSTIGLLVTLIFISMDIYLTLHHGAGANLGTTLSPMITVENFTSSGDVKSLAYSDGTKPSALEFADSSIGDSGILAAGNLLTTNKQQHKNSSLHNVNKSILDPAKSRLMSSEESRHSAMQKRNPNVEKFVSSMTEKNAAITDRKLTTEKNLVRGTYINNVNYTHYKANKKHKTNPTANTNVLNNDVLEYSTFSQNK